MAGDFVPEEELKLKGIQKHFNTYTLRGRFNKKQKKYNVGYYFFCGYLPGICDIFQWRSPVCVWTSYRIGDKFVVATYGGIFGAVLLYKLLTRGSKGGSEPKRPKLASYSKSISNGNRKEKACCCD